MVTSKTPDAPSSTLIDLQIIPLGIGSKLNIHKTFRRRPGRLLNVVCTFNLRPVSRGIVSLNHLSNKFAYYHPVLVYINAIFQKLCWYVLECTRALSIEIKKSFGIFH